MDELSQRLIRLAMRILLELSGRLSCGSAPADGLRPLEPERIAEQVPRELEGRGGGVGGWGGLGVEYGVGMEWVWSG